MQWGPPQSKETDREIEKLARKAELRSQEADRRFKETEQQMKVQTQEMKRLITEAHQRTDEAFRRAEGLFIGQWGKLMEALFEPGAAALFHKLGIKVDDAAMRYRRRLVGETMEVDILLENGVEVVAIEVKSTLRTKHVLQWRENLPRFTEFSPEHRGYRIYGAVAALRVEENADRFAYKNGMFVLRMGKEGLVRISNDARFQPRDFGGRTSV